MAIAGQRRFVTTTKIPTHALRFLLFRRNRRILVINNLTGNETMNFNNDEEAIDFFNRLLEQLHQAGFDNTCSHLSLIYVGRGAQHVDHVGSQYFYGDTYPKPKKPLKAEEPSATKTFNQDTPLSALFRENFHEDLRTVIESWLKIETVDRLFVKVAVYGKVVVEIRREIVHIDFFCIYPHRFEFFLPKFLYPRKVFHRKIGTFKVFFVFHIHLLISHK